MVIALLIVIVLALLGALVIVLPRLLRGELGALRDQASVELTARNADVDRRLEAVIGASASSIRKSIAGLRPQGRQPPRSTSGSEK